MGHKKRNRVALLAGCIGVAAGVGFWFGAPPDPTASASAPVPGQQIESGTIRYVVDRPGVGTAYVADRAGSDVLSVTIQDETTNAPTAGEVTNPAISAAGIVAWAEDQASIKLWDPRTDELTTLNRPESTSAVFSPTFVTNSKLAAVGQQPVSGVPGEDDGLNNLFEIGLDEGTWKPLTSFTATTTDWSAVRTPVATPEGDVLFVRVHGNSQATAQPDFELWTTSEAGESRVTRLPGEMYLAGFRNDTVMWNAPSETCNDWGLFAETPNGLEQVGCGAVLADPLEAVDPDLEDDEHSEFASPPAHDQGDLAVIVGDFASEDQAAAVETQMREVSRQRVATHSSLPHAVAPGAWVVVRPIPLGMSPDDALDEVRREVPAYADMAFIVSVGD